ncbi:MAG: hypothetical protein KKE05_03010 [Nanoarchaeota archaeon]|nr:hypothetical protein [Nanoarchaeota archaeon]
MKDKKNDFSGIAIPAFLLIGIGYGLLVGNVAAWTLIGLGLGFVIMLIIKSINRR